MLWPFLSFPMLWTALLVHATYLFHGRLTRCLLRRRLSAWHLTSRHSPNEGAGGYSNGIVIAIPPITSLSLKSRLGLSG